MYVDQLPSTFLLWLPKKNNRLKPLTLSYNKVPPIPSSYILAAYAPRSILQITKHKEQKRMDLDIRFLGIFLDSLAFFQRPSESEEETLKVFWNYHSDESLELKHCISLTSLVCKLCNRKGHTSHNSKNRWIHPTLLKLMQRMRKNPESHSFAFNPESTTVCYLIYSAKL